MASQDFTVTLLKGKRRVNNKIKPTTYVVKKGDSLYKIARMFYGDGARWTEVYQKNAATLKHPRLVPEGAVLYL